MKTRCGNQKNQLPNSDRAAQGCSPLYAEKMHASTAPISVQLLVYRRWILKIQQLIVAPHNPVTNHLCRPAFAGLAIRIKRFLHASAAVGPMRTLKAAAQTCVAMVAIAIAIARHLIHNAAGFGGSLVRGNLGRSNQALVRELLLRENGRQRGTGLGRRGMKRGDLSGLVYELRMRHAGSKKKG